MKPILTMDFETDPFSFKKKIKAFCVGLYDGKDFDSVWGDDCIPKIMKRLEGMEDSVIYMHNGGKFDIFLGLIPYLDGAMIIINGRIVKATLLGKHELRDSYAVLPIPLKAYKKDDIEIEKLETECRELHRAEILSYLHGDCVYLHELVSGFRDEFGDYLTIGSAAMAQLQKFHPFEKTKRYFDEKFRTQFFFGGRVQCFDSGIIHQPFKIYDVNSMYPFVMANYRHPTGAAYELDRSIRPDTAFVVGTGFCATGSFPVRSRAGISFPRGKGEFACTIHEWNAAIESGFFRPDRVLKTYNFKQWISFDEFVSHFYSARQKAKREADKIHEIFYKLILNSAYGKFAQNPDNYQDFSISHNVHMPEPWTEHKVFNAGEYVIWKKPITRHSYFNVSIGASITGSARSVLLRALSSAEDLVYCDTDSIIAGALHDVRFHETDLGAWKLEASGDKIAMAGKKLYACFDGDKCVKKANKGGEVSPQDIVRIAEGETITYRKQAPTFGLDGSIKWIERRLKKTV